MNVTLRRAIALWLPTAVVSTALAGLVYATVQQNYRQSANDPQLQMAEDTASGLSTGESPREVVTGEPDDLATSLAPYTIVYDAHGGVLASTAVLDGSTPTPPEGVLQTATEEGQDMVTWQPRPDVRSALEVVPWSSGNASGTVVAGRSLREIEQRVDVLTLMVGMAWVVVLLGGAVAALVGAWLWGWSAKPSPIV